MSGSRANLCARAAVRWSEELVGLGGRDPLLSFRDLKVGTLDLAAAEPKARQRLMDGESVPVSKLFPYDPLRSSALRSVRAIRDKGRELAEERGIAGTRLAVGVATWADPFAAHRAMAPVLLRSATVVAQDPAETDFMITIADDSVVNPVLIHALDTRLGLRFTAHDLRDHYGNLRYPTVVEKLHEYAPPHVVDGFSIAHRAVVATFATEPLLLSQDILHLGTTLEENQVVAALAGDEEARNALWVQPRREAMVHQTFALDPGQRGVVEAVASGSAIHIDAPPGSGHTQAVAATIADQVGRGKRVLVVGEKRTTLTDLVSRLTSVGLGDLVVDMTRTSAADAVEQVVGTARSLISGTDGAAESGATSAPPSAADADLVQTVDGYAEALHRPREPWDVSAWQALVAVTTAAPGARTQARIPADILRATPDLAPSRARLHEFAESGGLTLSPDGSPWYGADIGDGDTADEALAIVAELRATAVPALRDTATRAAVEVGLAGPTSVADCLEIVDLLDGVGATVERFGDEIWDEPLDDLAAATADGRGSGLGLFAGHRMRARARELTGNGRGDRVRTHRWLERARRNRDEWAQRSRGAKRPRTGPHLPGALVTARPVRELFDRLAGIHPATADLIDAEFDDVGTRLRALADDESHLRTMPRLRELQAALTSAGVDDLLEHLRSRGADGSVIEDVDVQDVLGYAQFASLLELWRSEDPVLRDTDPATVERAISELTAAEAELVAAAVPHVRKARAEHVVRVAAELEGQAAVLGDAESPAPSQSPRDLVAMAPDVALAAVPVWVMSPLSVAEWLPPQRLFDVVIIEDAGRTAVAQAVPALARGAQVVLVGDDEVARTSFTTVVDRSADRDDSESPWADEPDLSVVDALRGVLPPVGLSGQHRVRDDSLVGFAARTTYAGRMRPVPGVRGHGRLGMELIEAVDGGDDPVDSSSAEVARVVDLVLEHVRVRAHESLGVVTLGPRHADRIDAALRRALVRAPDVARYLHEGRAEPFFVKDVESVGGDVRDAIILALGYGRSVDGRILYRFGALSRPGGERRLTSATTRSRERLTVVSTFGADDLSPRRLTTPGSQALGEFLSYVERAVGTGDSPDDDVDTSAVDRLAETIATRLTESGAQIEVGVGGPGGIPVAVRHPARRQRFVLAVLTDGPHHVPLAQSGRQDRVEAEELRRLGWSVHRVWAASWAQDPEGETQRLLDAFEAAVRDADAYDWAVAAAEADIVAGVPADVDAPRASGPSESKSEETATDSPPATDDSAAGDSAADEEPADTSDAEGSSTVDDADESPAAEDAADDAATEAASVDNDSTGDVKSTDDHDPIEDEVNDPDHVRVAEKVEAPPPLPLRRPIGDYHIRDLAGVVRWLEADGEPRDESEVVSLLRRNLDLADDSRTIDVAVHAVRVARAGAPPYRPV